MKKKCFIFYLSSLEGMGGAEVNTLLVIRELSKTADVKVICDKPNVHEKFSDLDIIFANDVLAMNALSLEYNNENCTFVSVLRQNCNRVINKFNKCKFILQWHSIVGRGNLKNGQSYVFSHINSLKFYNPDVLTVLGVKSQELLKVEYGLDSEVLHNAFVMPETGINDRNDSRTIGFVGNDRHEKNLDLLHSIINLAPKKLIFQIYGSWKNETVEKFKNDFGTQFNYNGVVSQHEEIFPYLDVLISTSTVEGWGRNIIEANSFGVPSVVLYKNENVGEVVDDKVSGRIIYEEDAGEFLKAIDEVGKYDKEGIISHAKRFDVSKVADELMEISSKIKQSKSNKFKRILIYTDQLKQYGGIEDIFNEIIPKIKASGVEVFVAVGGDKREKHHDKGEWFVNLEKHISGIFELYSHKGYCDFIDFTSKYNNAGTLVYVPKYWHFDKYNKSLNNCYIYFEWHGGVQGEYGPHIIKIFKTCAFDAISFLGETNTRIAVQKVVGSNFKISLPIYYSKVKKIAPTKKENVIAWVGRFNKNKNPFMAIDAFKKMLELDNFLNFKLKMYGEFLENNPTFGKEKIQEYITNAGLENKVILCGFKEKSTIFSEAKFLLNTSTEEGWGNVFYDALSYRAVPIVPRSISVIDEVLPDNVSIKYASVDDLVEKMKNVEYGSFSNEVDQFIKNFDDNKHNILSILKEGVRWVDEK